MQESETQILQTQITSSIQLLTLITLQLTTTKNQNHTAADILINISQYHFNSTSTSLE